MPDRIVIFDPDEPLKFLEDACAALAVAVNEVHAWRPSEQELFATYAELVSALARLVRDQMPDEGAQLAIVDHLIERTRQARAGELTPPLADIVDRLHAEISRELARN